MTSTHIPQYGALLVENDDNDKSEARSFSMESQRLISDENNELIEESSEAPSGIDPEQCQHNSNNRSKKRTGLAAFVIAITALSLVGLLVYMHQNSNAFSKSDSNASPYDTSVASLSATASMSSSIPSTTTISTVGNTTTSNNKHDFGSLFFEHVLRWQQMEMPDTFEEQQTGTKHSGSNHYHATLEFCSDPKKGLYAFGPVGNCVPGKPAPLIKMKPKTFYHLTLVNNAHIDTNIHTHGLHVSGVGTVDDVTRVAEPGKCLEYEYYILDDADVGTFWYHPHRHPLVTKSAFGGAYGMIIVEETIALEEKYYPDHLANFLTQNEVVLQLSSMYNKVLENPVRTNKVNGQDLLDLVLGKDTFYYFRVSSVVYAESINYVEFDPPDACEVRVVAYDGVYRSEIPGPTSMHKHMMTVSSRGDFAVSCSTDADIHFHQGKMTGKESKMVQIRVEEQDSVASSSNFTHVSLQPSLPSSPYWDEQLQTSWKPRRPYYMPDLSAQEFVDEYWHVSMDDYFVNGTKGVSVNQQVWDPNVALRDFDLGQLVEFPILLSQTHPYHAHINRMQIVQHGGCGLRFEEGEYFDTIVQSKETEECLVRVKFYDFAGRLVIHCHRFGHEDKGMMTWIDVLGGHGHGIEAAPQTTCPAGLL